MNMEIDIIPPSPEEEETAAEGLASPIYGKHHRQFSTSAKWASNKALALEYLKRQREIIVWIEHVLERKLDTNDLHEALKSGVVLRELLIRLYPAPSECLSPISRNYSARMAPWKERENISVFLKQCRALGMNDFSLFCTDDLYQGSNMVQVLFGIQHFIKFSEDQSDELIAPVKCNEPMTFSNQEVEMAMSKIEMVGADSTSFKDLVTAASMSQLNVLSEEQEAQKEKASKDAMDALEEELEHEATGTSNDNQQEEPAGPETIQVDVVDKQVEEQDQASKEEETAPEEQKTEAQQPSEVAISLSEEHIESQAKTEPAESFLHVQQSNEKDASIKKKAKAASTATKKERQTTEEQIEDEVMRSCTCGKSCSIM